MEHSGLNCSDTIEAWLQLALRPGLGPSRLRVLLERYPSPQDILDLSDQEKRALPAALAKPLLAVPDPERYRVCLDWLQAPEHHLLTWDHPGYPQQLLQIYDPPPLLFVAGNPALLCDPQIALVGTRKPSPAGRQSSYQIAAELAQAGITITSGLALGIDGAAHSGALSVAGSTIAVLGCGLKRCYPRAHRALAEEILAAGGALVSEFWPQSEPKAGHFPKRNRIISGLSLGVLVVEAASISGSLITARQALEQGREVFALPGAVQNTQTHGCHELIRQGATLVEHAGHILEALAGPLQQSQISHAEPVAPPVCESLSHQDQAVLAAIDFSQTSFDQIVQRTGLVIAQLQPRLLALEVAGWIGRVPGGVQRLR